MKGFTELEVGRQDLLSLDRPKAIETLIQHSQHDQQDLFAAANERRRPGALAIVEAIAAPR